tara:strand:- start:101 stop:748 length:648 start_codon:yes stop_codon:yes gene_type:complete
VERKARANFCGLKLKKFIYLISPNKIDRDFYKSLNKVLSSGIVKYFQLRLKIDQNSNFIKIAKKISLITKKHKVKFIINDFPSLAKLTKADGCHLGQKDVSVKLARKLLKKKIIGITCHGSKKLILNARKQNVDYIALGSFFKSKLKPSAKKAKKNLIRWCKQRTNLPIVAIGGINNKNYKTLIKLGANYLAISSFIWNNPRLKPEKAIKKFELK